MSEIDENFPVYEFNNGLEFKSLIPSICLAIFMFVVAMSMFELAVRFDLNRLFAPRSYARPKQIVKNIIKKPYCLRWIPWALSLKYSEMLDGIKGTGTRNNGWSGMELKCNLDGIILIKFCNLCLKVSVLATILCLLIVLPVNFTARCKPEAYKSIQEGIEFCSNYTTLTTFEQTTLANIPRLVSSPNSTWYSIDMFTNAFDESTGNTLRMFTIILVAFVIYTYTCVLIWEEWIQNLALRRAYYLEFNHYEYRKKELEHLDNLEDPEGSNIIDRPVFVPHPELRDTVPNTALYSVLFRLPSVEVDTGSCISNSGVGRQLQVAIDFFDKVVPNQPGYSSSVAALTILPDVKRLSQAWKKWYGCASKVRRLKFIRQRLRQVHEGQNGIDGSGDCYQHDHRSNNTETKIEASRNHGNNAIAGNRKLETVDEGSSFDLPSHEKGKVDTTSDITDGIPKSLADNVKGLPSSMLSLSRAACTEDDLESARRLASAEIKEESNMEMFLDDDEIEQMTVYYREFARSSASCCAHGCDEHSILQADAITLAELEQEAAEEVHIAIEELRQARIEIRVDRPTAPQLHSVHQIPSDQASMDDERFSDLNERQTSIQIDHKEVTHNHTLEGHGLRNTSNCGGTVFNTWEEAEKLVGSEQYMFKRGGQIRKRTLSTGSWYNPFGKYYKESTNKRVVGNVVPSGVLSRIIKSDSYAVVTFTSRQAAIAARQCLGDGSGLEGWKEVDKIPIPPLSDAVPWDLTDCRGCCRPVTLTLPREQKRGRFKIIVALMIVFIALWTYPFLDIPHIDFYAQYLYLIIDSLVMTTFFAILPQIFKGISNFGSGATSIQEAERYALMYFWWFMVIWAFGGRTIGGTIITAFQDYDVTVARAQQIVYTLANNIPTSTSFRWIGWILLQTGMILPFMYFLQFNNFLFTALKLDCCARGTAGGGPGGVVPYRIYVNAGVIFLCVVALAPLCPVLAPVAMLAFLFISPLLKWAHIFVYRPTFDAGGMRWPLLHDILMFSVIVGQAILAICFFLKKAFLVGIISVLSIIPTLTFRSVCKDTFEQCYNDAALLQTSELDGWSVNEDTSMLERERYRKWLVDCHKASYVPVCVNAEDNFLTSEPAVVIATERDQDVDPFQPIPPVDSRDSRDQSSGSSPVSYGRQRTSTLDSYSSFRSQNSKSQRGALFRRVIRSSMFHIPAEDSDQFHAEECLSRGSGLSVPHHSVETNLDDVLEEEGREKSF